MPYIIRVKEDGALGGRYIEGPCGPHEVKRSGYRFGQDSSKAWPFPSQKQASNKARIVERHMSMAAGWMEVIEVTKCCNAPDIIVRAMADNLESGAIPHR